MKAFTDIEQSKKLAEILPLESADMWWIALNWQETEYYVEIKQDGINQPKKAIPCWSLSALLDILPTKLQIVLAINDFQGDRKEKYVIGSVEHDKYDCYADNPVDACYKLILRLHELKML